MNVLQNWILTLTIFTPAAGAIIIGFLSHRQTRTIRTVALIVSLVSLILTGIVVTRFCQAGPTDTYVLEQNVLWLGSPSLPGVEIRYHVGVDGISVFLLAMTALLLFLSVVYSTVPVTERIKEYYIFLLILGTSCMGVFCAVDVLLFYIFFEFVLVPLYFLIGIWGGENRQFAATKFFVYTIVGSLITFAGIIYLALQARNLGGRVSFDIPQLIRLAQTGTFSTATQLWIFAAMFVGFAIKVPLFPFHTWLPLAHTEAPTTGSVFLAGVLLKLGTYGFLRFCLPILPQATLYFAPLMAFLAVIAILYGALAAWAQADFKRLVAYSSVSHMGFCILGLFTAKPVGVTGALLLMVNHGISTGALFLVVGMIYDRYHTHKFGEIRGLARTMPVLTFFAVLFGLSSMGLPGLNGFVSEFMILVGAFTSATSSGGTPPGPLHMMFGVFAAGGIILSVIYILHFIRQVFFGPEHLPPSDPRYSRDLGPREIGVLAPLAVLVVLIGIWPEPITRAMMPACKAVVDTIMYVAPSPADEELMACRTSDGCLSHARQSSLADILADSGPNHDPLKQRLSIYGCLDNQVIVGAWDFESGRRDFGDRRSGR